MARPQLLMLDEPSLGLAPMVVREIFRIVRELNERDGPHRARRRAGREDRARHGLDRVRARGRARRGRGAERRAARERVSPPELPGVLRAWPTSCSRSWRGSRRASIYASLALALVLIHRATGVINFAQGEMATFSTYIAWTLTTNHGWSYWPAFAVDARALVRRRSGVHQGVIRPNEKGSVLRVVIVTIGLLLFINGLVTMIWSGEVRAVQSPFPTGRSRSAVSRSRSRTSARSAS